MQSLANVGLAARHRRMACPFSNRWATRGARQLAGFVRPGPIAGGKSSQRTATGQAMQTVGYSGDSVPISAHRREGFQKSRSATAAVASVVDARIAVPVMCGRTRAGPASAARRRGADQARRQRRERHEQDHDREEPHHPSIVNARLGAMPPDGVGPPIHANWRTIFRATKSCAEATAHGRGTTAAVAPVTSSTFTNRPTRRRYVFASPSTKRPPSQTRCTTVTTSSAKRRWL